MDTQLQDLLDHEHIRRCIARLARGEDRRDAALLQASFWPDATVDFGVFQGSFDQYLAWVVPGADVITNTQHVVAQSHIECDGRSARVETQVMSYHRIDMGAGERDTVIGGRYLDLFEQRGCEWRVAARKMLYDWYSDWGAAVDWSQGVMGLSFSDPRFPGRAHGDWSEDFFAADSPSGS